MKSEIIAFVLLFGVFGIGFIGSSSLLSQEQCSDDNCILLLVEETQDASICENKECFERASFLLNDFSLCSSSECYLGHAVFNKNISLCEYVDLEQGDCVFQIASNNLDSTLCEESQDSSRCYYSYALFAQNESLCSKSGSYEKSCLEKLE